MQQQDTAKQVPTVFAMQVVLFEDLVQRQQALQVLMGYNPFWLTLAVEVVTHKPFRPQGQWCSYALPVSAVCNNRPYELLVFTPCASRAYRILPTVGSFAYCMQ